MDRHFLYSLITTFTLSASCQTGPQPNNNSLKSTLFVKQAANTNILLTSDTTVVLSGIVSSIYRGSDLYDSIAKRVLYNHFKQQGYLTPENLPDITRLTKADEDKLSVDFTSIVKADINNNKYTDAVITYWLTPPYANGHCWRPHKAIISDTDNGYQITKKEFIPDSFGIDSVLTANSQIIVFGYDYECTNHKTLRNLKVRLRVTK